MVVCFFSCKRHTHHKSEGMLKVAELKAADEAIVFFFPHGFDFYSKVTFVRLETSLHFSQRTIPVTFGVVSAGEGVFVVYFLFFCFIVVSDYFSRMLFNVDKLLSISFGSIFSITGIIMFTGYFNVPALLQDTLV